MPLGQDSPTIGIEWPLNGRLDTKLLLRSKFPCPLMRLPVIELAIGLAAAGRRVPPPNPSVGCVIVSIEGNVLGQGHTQRAGGFHAEIVALRDAAAKGHSVCGAIAYVTLEPCSHHGRTGPCCDALIDSGISKVVASLADPNPLVSGQGFTRLRAAGIEVEVGPGAEASRDLNIGFFSRMIRKKPWVRMKFAASLDGKTALENGVSHGSHRRPPALMVMLGAPALAPC